MVLKFLCQKEFSSLVWLLNGSLLALSFPLKLKNLHLYKISVDLSIVYIGTRKCRKQNRSLSEVPMFLRSVLYQVENLPLKKRIYWRQLLWLQFILMVVTNSILNFFIPYGRGLKRYKRSSNTYIVLFNWYHNFFFHRQL